jgi:hypothetical protein
LHGKGGDEPYAVMAYGAEGDFNFLEVGRAAFDLSDRGVSGRDRRARSTLISTPIAASTGLARAST